MVTWFFLLLFLALACSAGYLAARSYLTGEPIAAFFSRTRVEPRLSVVEQTSVDNRRKLLLVRRDGVEHLIMTGGPVDIVIETGIGALALLSQTAGAPAIMQPQRIRPESELSVVATPVVAAPVAATPVAATPVFGRQARALGHVVNE